jgi:thymidylate kinase
MHLYYHDLILQAPEPVVFDRSFLAELVYGLVLRGTSRLSLLEMQSLLECLAKKNVVVLYLSESQEVLTQRLIETRDAHPQVLEHLDELILAYEHYFQIVARYVQTYTLCPTAIPKEQLLDHIVQLINK